MEAELHTEWIRSLGRKQNRIDGHVRKNSPGFNEKKKTKHTFEVKRLDLGK